MSEMQTVYEARRLCDGLTAIEDGGVRCFLVEGTERAMLVDTGFGKGDLRAFVKTLNATLHGRGGGKPFFVQGSVTASKTEITDFFHN